MPTKPKENKNKKWVTMDSLSLITRDDLFTAVANGDIATLDAYFAQDHVRAEVEETEAHIIAHTPPHLLPIGPRTTPWHHEHQIQRRFHRSGFLFGIAIDCHQLDVVNWFFSPKRAAIMGATLSLLLPAIGFCALEAGSFGAEILELVLSSVVFTELLSPAQQLDVLHMILIFAGRGVSAAVMELLIAHGANVNYRDGDLAQEPLRQMAGSRMLHFKMWTCVSHVDLLVQHGAFVVGSKALTFRSYLEDRRITCRLLELGAVWHGDDGPGNVLATLAQRPHEEAVTLALKVGFADVDSRTADGETALMAAVQSDPFGRIGGIDNRRMETVLILIAYGADVRLRDTNGRTALDFAVESELRDVVEFLSTVQASIGCSF